MRLILTGVTGVAGLAIYRAALNDPDVQHVTLLTRRAVPSWAELPPNAAEKTEIVLHTDFKTYAPDLAARLASHDALIWALGKSAMGMSEEAYTELTYEYTLAAARALKDAGAGSADKPFRFVFISGELADPTGKSRQMWARVKGRVERELPELFIGSNMTAHVYRPAYFFPSKDYPEDRRNQRSVGERILDVTLGAATKALAPSFYTPLEQFGPFVLEVAKGRWPNQELFRNADMRRLMESFRSTASHGEL
ncbi:hypothetical protein C8Q80DRAFT_1105707 [Daedaleopsis nitida]|nr:hypothetical protein C8Q80DRAFT_1105707 [Daedaleopsis nitida]